MATQLTDFIESYLDRPFAWGVSDCSLFVADWWAFVHGVDPARHLRGAYSTAYQARSIVARAGGLAALVGGIAKAAGATETTSEADGAFGVVISGFLPRAAIRAPGAWAMRTEDGIAFVRDVKVVRLWSV